MLHQRLQSHIVQKALDFADPDGDQWFKSVQAHAHDLRIPPLGMEFPRT